MLKPFDTASTSLNEIQPGADPGILERGGRINFYERQSERVGAHSARLSRGVRGHAPLENFDNLSRL